MKKILLTLLGVLIALPAFARDFTYGSMTYTVIDEDARTCKTKEGSWGSAGNYASGKLTIPSVAKDGDIEYSVIEIGAFAFTGETWLTQVTIPNSVTSIGPYAFYNCSRLTQLTIPNSVTSIGGYAFYDCI